ncbi:MAG TPA: bifunctional phosphopantothenoylcysteine decarboxylase/phosphopantothenate--cysteine ligase CoaBC [Gaiellaceae bacterium]|nr:bifunctional phosphopantothenoylcysteine decarboxylase/phosphopantothenate--cysteine ligase CoaBC [Gaiellaceae bacterium]
MARVLLGVTGGIAAYKACELTRLLVKAGHEVIPLVTRGADRFVRRETFAALARRPAKEDVYPHLARADLLVIAPLTANTMAKLAHGLADDVLTEAVLAHRGPVLVAPAMSPRMWAHPATQANAATLRERGVELIGPGEGETAEGELGLGRMAEPQEIFARVQDLLGARKGSLHGKRVLVTAGGTREPLDAIRFVGNRSSGRMGVALAEEAQRRGAEVLLVASNITVPTPTGVVVVDAPTAADLERATAHTDADVVLMAAAVSDYRPAETDMAKRPKDEQTWKIELEPTADVLKGLGEQRQNGQFLVGFAAETAENGLERARKKLADKQVDLIVYNDVSREDVGFDAEDNEVVIVSAQGERRVEKAPKEAIAAAILDEVERLI